MEGRDLPLRRDIQDDFRRSALSRESIDPMMRITNLARDGRVSAKRGLLLFEKRALLLFGKHLCHRGREKQHHTRVSIFRHKSEKIPRNEFLSTTKQYGDFIESVKFKVLDKGVNAGVQFRTKRIPNHPEVSGYKAYFGQKYFGSL